MKHKQASSALFWIILVVIIILITSTQKITFNGNPVSTGSPTTCGFMRMNYDATTRTCVSTMPTNETKS